MKGRDSDVGASVSALFQKEMDRMSDNLRRIDESLLEEVNLLNVINRGVEMLEKSAKEKAVKYQTLLDQYLQLKEDYENHRAAYIPEARN